MKYLLCIATICVLLGCGSKSKKTDAVPGSDSTGTATKDSVPPAPPVSGKIDIEKFGDIKLGMPAADAIKVLGEPTNRSKAAEWGADGMMHQDWNWTSKGLVVNMTWDVKNEATTKSIFSITATTSCTFKTAAGMGIGNSYAEVESAYKRDIDTTGGEADKTRIVVGSVYGGIIFSFEQEKVKEIFLGAAAE